MRRTLSYAEMIRFRLRAIEHTRLPDPLRRILVKALPNPFLEGRSKHLGDGREIVFLHIPKTGGTSLSQVLGLRFGHVAATRFEANDRERFSRAFKFAFVRHPVDRLFSSFNYLKVAQKTGTSPDVRWSETYLERYRDFEDFAISLRQRHRRRIILQWPHFMPMHYWLCRPGDSVPMVDFLGRFETLADDTNALASRLGIKIDLPHLRKPQGYIKKHISIEAAEVIRDVYKLDFEIFGY